eukprot:3102259-Rhodomonas_salina.2
MAASRTLQLHPHHFSVHQPDVAIVCSVCERLLAPCARSAKIKSQREIRIKTWIIQLLAGGSDFSLNLVARRTGSVLLRRLAAHSTPETSAPSPEMGARPSCMDADLAVLSSSSPSPRYNPDERCWMTNPL